MEHQDLEQWFQEHKEAEQLLRRLQEWQASEDYREFELADEPQ